MIPKDTVSNVCSPYGICRMLGTAWVIFTTVYFLLSIAAPYVIARTQGNALQGSYQNGQAKGYESAVLQLGQSLVGQMKDGCKEPIPINIGGTGSIGIVSVDCLAVAAQNAAAAQGAQQTPPAGAR